MATREAVAVFGGRNDRRRGDDGESRGGSDLRFGFTTGACATAAAKAAAIGCLSGRIPSQVQITLPRGEVVTFDIVEAEVGPSSSRAAVQKDAGDDPDVTHGALVFADVELVDNGEASVTFIGGDGVGTVTKPGLPIAPGEPAINPVPREMMTSALLSLDKADVQDPSFKVTISVPGGVELARQTWNPRLGIEGGLSILGTTGIVRPFSCAAWIASIHRGIDVARATGIKHAIGSTGATSERVAQVHFAAPDHAMLDMGDFAGGLLKYLRNHPIERLTIAGGFGKLTKLAQGHLDLHSSRSQVDFTWLAAHAPGDSRDAVMAANTAQHALELAGAELAKSVAIGARETATVTVRGAPIAVDVLIIDRAGRMIATADETGGHLP
ncbi:MAG: cobalt-precorrin-5B (C(1))-methyltransferase [Pseudomonadota bacterium]